MFMILEIEKFSVISWKGLEELIWDTINDEAWESSIHDRLSVWALSF